MIQSNSVLAIKLTVNLHRFLETILDKANTLQDERIDYPKDPILNDDRFRHILQWNFKIIYQRTESKVIIIEIFHTKRDPGKLIL